MKRIKMNIDYGFWAKKGGIYDVNDWLARTMLKKHLRRDQHGRHHLYSHAELVEDLGRHIGQSKHTYDMNGESKAFGPGQPPKEVVSRDEILEAMIKKMNAGIKIFKCKLCGYNNNPDIYATTKIKGRWWHRFCLKRATWHTMKLINSGQHDQVKMLKMFRGKEHDARRREC